MNRSQTRRLLTGLALLAPLVSLAQTEPGPPAPMPLWQSAAPGTPSDGTASRMRITPQGEHVFTHIAQPSITPFLPSPAMATGAAVIVIPGGGHTEIWIDHEGYAVAQWLSAHGVAAFVLQYRLAREKGSTYTVEGTELADTLRAIRTVRSRSQEFGVDPKRIGVMGFSAGGELAALASTRFADASPAQPATPRDALDDVSARPDFQALIYPGLPQDPRLTAQTPPAFLACGAKDRVTISQGLAAFYLALARLGVSAELHVYAGIGHGFGLRASNPSSVAEWPELFLDWLGTEGLLKPAK